MIDIASQYLPAGTVAALDESHHHGPGALVVADVHQRVTGRLGPVDGDMSDELVAFAGRTQRFLDDLDSFTGWRHHDTPSG
ncbi:MAG: hypothetical protein ACXIVQ_02650 [Acidimicrobiales bacterium]